MFNSEEEIEPQSVEYEEHKRRREQRKKEKMQLLEVNHISEILPSTPSELQAVQDSITLYDASPSQPRVKINRRRIRTTKNDKIDVDNEFLLENMSESEMIALGLEKPKEKRKARTNRRKTRTKKNSNSEVDGEALSNIDIDSVTIDMNDLILQSFSGVVSCCGDSSTKIKTPNKKKKMKNLLTSNNVTVNGIQNFESKSKSLCEKKAMPSPKTPEDRRNKKRNSNNVKDKSLRNGTVEQSPTTSKEKFNEYMDLEEVKKGLESGLLFIGNIRINPKDHKLSYVSNPVKNQQDILLTSMKDRNGALESDKVVIKLKDESEWKSNNQKTAFVVYILEHVHPRTAVGVLKLMPDKNKRFAMFHPRDSRVPRMKIPFTDWPVSFFENVEQYEKALFLGKITKWIDPRFPIGTLIKNIGLAGNIETESVAILAENCLDVTPFGDEMKQYFPESGDIDPKEFEYRLDLRKECIFTIDPLTARDLDDAVSCKSLPNGNLEIGVHISDVSFYLKENTPLEEKVANKATSIYMVESVYHMLPRELCMMCSLLPGEDKLAFSVFWEMTPEGKVISHRFSKTVINSCVQLAYEHAQLMIENPAKEFAEHELPEIHNGFKAEDLIRIVNSLHKIALNLRQSRYQSGALRLDQPKVSFSLNPVDGLPLSYHLYENKECHRLIEEFMLLANITVATRLRNDYPNIAFLRSHPAPHDYMMQNLKATLEKVGIHLDVSSAGGLQQTLWKYTGDDILSQARMLVLNLMCARPMTRAHYFCAANSNDTEDYWHYALSVPLYTHFTSPIRRFADIVVHRQLAGSLGYTEKPDWTSEYVITAAGNCNKQKYNAKRAGEQSIELYLIHYIDRHQPIIEKAVVMDVKDNSFDAIIITNGLTIRIYLNNFDEGVSHQFLKEEDDDDGTQDEGKKLLNLLVQWPAQDNKPSASQIIAMFSVITVSLSKKEKVHKLDAKLVRPDM